MWLAGALVMRANAFLSEGEGLDGIENARFFDSVGEYRIETPVEVFGRKVTLASSSTIRKWLYDQQRRGVRRLRLFQIRRNVKNLPPEIHIAFVGGGNHSMLECMFDGYSALWALEEALRPQVAARLLPVENGGNIAATLRTMAKNSRMARESPRRNRVTLHRIVARSESLEAPTIADAVRRLREALTDALAWGERFNDSFWSGRFQSALERLDGKSDQHGPVPPIGLHGDAQRLFDAVMLGWCFGGMGSFMDRGIQKEQKADFDAFYGRLFDVMEDAFVAGVNG